ncbi:hypothetical protein AQ915_20725 [Burkholderia pseudomallei]|uniref:hypothetical protein n=1 Tax=Burkholderia pseudomallei TaxID=28450 RepID=UPI000978604F|nr:hypothetical protein [Burkholderia pseudomallei]ONC30080.1 hypothetical protein AQ915_20725 [Burkholderia pseudomallei]
MKLKLILAALAITGTAGLATLAHAQQANANKPLSNDVGKHFAVVGEPLRGVDDKILLLRAVNGPGTVGVIVYNEPGVVDRDYGNGHEYTAWASKWEYSCKTPSIVRTESDSFGFAPGQDVVGGGFLLNPATYHTISQPLVERTLAQLCGLNPAA